MSLESDVAYISHHRVQPACLDELDDAPDVIAEPAPAPPVRRQPITSPTADAPRNLGPLTPMALMARAGLTADERLAVMDVLGELNDYLASAAIYAKGGTALAEFLQVCLSDSVGIWPAAVADAHLETQLPDALATAAAKLDVQIRMHFPRLSETGLQRL